MRPLILSKMTLTYDNFLSSQVTAFTSDRTVDFNLNKNQGIFDKAQKDFFFSYLKFDLPQVVNIRQVHGSRVIVLDKLFFPKDTIEEADGLITNLKNLPLAVRTADCLPIFLYDAFSQSIGLVHAGWRGSQQGIVGEALKLMKQFYHSEVKNVKVILGPTIRSCCYQVGNEFADHFPRETMKRENSYYLDLPEANKHQLIDFGIQEENIFDSGVCTCCHKEYFSYRREGPSTGRMISMMMLR